MKSEERILCVSRKDLPAEWLFENGAIRMEQDAFLKEAGSWKVNFVRRGDAETDSSLKQLIPYCAVFRSDGCVLAYPRHGSETRLHGLYSIGVGGHVNDGDEVAEDLYATLLRGAKRELAEELGEVPCSDLKFVGVLNEELTSAGGVHFGIVFSLVLTEGYELQPRPELEGSRFIGIADLQALHLEHWSRLAMSLFAS